MADLVRSPERHILLVYRYADGCWVATSPDLEEFEVSAPNLRTVVAEAVADLTPWIDPAVRLVHHVENIKQQQEHRMMTPEQLLNEVHEAGVDRGADLHDGLDGWLGWRISDGVLTVKFEPADGEGNPGPASTASWQLTPAAQEQTAV